MELQEKERIVDLFEEMGKNVYFEADEKNADVMNALTHPTLQTMFHDHIKSEDDLKEFHMLMNQCLFLKDVYKDHFGNDPSGFALLGLLNASIKEPKIRREMVKNNRNEKRIKMF